MTEWTARSVVSAGSLRRVLLSAFIVVVVAAAVLGGLYGYRTFRNLSQPPPASLPVGPAAPALPARGEGALPFDPRRSADGTWRIVEDGEGFVGYRITEQLAFLPVPNSAVGRTSEVEGRLVIAGTQIAEAEIVADVESLTSDEPNRDATIRTRGLESSTYPQAVFRLTEPVDLGGPPQRARVYTVEAPGELTLRGVTRPVVLELAARWTTNVIDVAGSTQVRLSDFDIEAPVVGPVVSIQDEATIELQVAFRRDDGR